MQHSSSVTLEQIRSDQALRPYFFEFICKGFLLGLTDKFEVPHVERVRFQKDYYDSLLDLSSRIGEKVKPDEVLPTIHEVSAHYLAHIGRIGFEHYQPTNK
jgi:hypothetical protein